MDMEHARNAVEHYYDHGEILNSILRALHAAGYPCIAG